MKNQVSRKKAGYPIGLKGWSAETNEVFLDALRDLCEAIGQRFHPHGYDPDIQAPGFLHSGSMFSLARLS